MRFDASQHMRMGQNMKLAPRMIQSMEILQMPLAELQERIEQELESNPTLELAEPGDSFDSLDAQNLNDAAREGLGLNAEVRESSDDAVLQIDASGGASEFERLDSFEAANPDAIDNDYALSDRASSYDGVSSDGSGAVERSLDDRRNDGGFDERAFEDRAVIRRDGERDAKMDAMAAAPARSDPLHEQLLRQWALADVDPTLRPLGERIISNLADDGYLRTPLETIAAENALLDPTQLATTSTPTSANPSQQTLHNPAQSTSESADPRTDLLRAYERALHAVQLFLEPAGVAARTASECLILQLDALADEGESLGWPVETFDHARTLVRDHIEDLMQNRLPRVAERSGLSLLQIRDALTLLKRLSLAPARRLTPEETAPITPDAIIEFLPEHDRYVAYLNEGRMPALRINQEYAKLTRDRSIDKQGREFVRTNVSNAQWLIDAIGQRKRTLLRVVQAVAVAQREYFDFGPQALKPLPMTQVADELGIHVATVSRAVSDKFVRTPRGIVPLRRFFSGGVQTKDETGGDAGGEMAWDAIKAALREVIDHEDKKSPLSDEALVDELKRKGIEIARRTIAKYRDQLSIPTARMRKQYS